MIGGQLEGAQISRYGPVIDLGFFQNIPQVDLKIGDGERGEERGEEEEERGEEEKGEKGIGRKGVRVGDGGRT